MNNVELTTAELAFLITMLQNKVSPADYSQAVVILAKLEKVWRA